MWNTVWRVTESWVEMDISSSRWGHFQLLTLLPYEYFKTWFLDIIHTHYAYVLIIFFRTIQKGAFGMYHCWKRIISNETQSSLCLWWAHDDYLFMIHIRILFAKLREFTALLITNSWVIHFSGSTFYAGVVKQILTLLCRKVPL